MKAAKRSAPRGAPVKSHARHVMYASSPLLASKTPPWRSKFLVLLVALGSTLLLGRAVYVQWIDAAFYQKQGERRYARTLELQASRGKIIDRNGLILASSVPAASLWAIPKDFNADKAQRRQLAKLLEMTPQEFEDRLDSNPNFVWLRRQVDDTIAAQALALDLKGVHQVREYKRKYPEGEALAQVVGFTNLEQQGQEGIELAFQKDLAGRNGSRRVIKDRFGRVVEDVGDSVASVHGRDVQLSIDSKLQFYAYQRLRDAVREHKAKAGSVVVLDARNGEVLAIVNYPSYTPGQQRKAGTAPLRNKALTDTFEPGSTMKPFVAALALESKRVTPDSVIQTAPGRMVVGNSTIIDAHPHGALTVNEVIQKSSNVGTVKMAMQMQPREMWELYSRVGFGHKPEIAFPGAVTGRLRPYKNWRPIEQATMSFGYGMSTSLFQLARAYGVFANDGSLLPTSLLKDSIAAPGVSVISAQTAAQVRHMLALAAGRGGTAAKAQTMGYSVGGKTGTARKQEGGVYVEKKYRSWFVGMAPISRPRIVVAVMLDEPSNGKYFGGDVAAPVFSEVVQQTLRALVVPPDLDVKSQVITEPTDAVEESF
ncbi:MAG: penicillin-binding protein 2 [Burkholderiaceae bacterium]